MDERLCEKATVLNKPPADLARDIVTTIYSVRFTVRHSTSTQFKNDSLHSQYTLVRCIVSNKTHAASQKTTTVQKGINSQLYDFAMDQLRRDYLGDAPDPNVTVRSVGAPRQGADVHTLFDVQEGQAIFDESKTGSGLRFKNGRFKRLR